MKVLSAPGTRCPMERNHREYITDAVVVEVPETTYYRRLIADGSLRVATEPVKEKEGGKK